MKMAKYYGGYSSAVLFNKTRFSIILGLITIIVTLQVLAEKHTCPYLSQCRCTETFDGIYVLCHEVETYDIHRTLEQLKQNVTPIYSLQITDSEFPRLADFQFQGLEIQKITMRSAKLGEIEKDSFSGVEEIDSINLSRNRLQKIPSDAINILKNVTYLNLDHNKISAISSSAFAGMESLDGISLYGNRIAEVHYEAFKGTIRITKLNLGGNRLRKVPEYLSRYLKKLQILNLKENLIASLPYESLKEFYLVKELYLSGNAITEIDYPSFQDLHVLNTLNLTDNKISKVGYSTFSGKGEHLEVLSMGRNELSRVPDLSSQPNLRILDLYKNKIESIGESDFSAFGKKLTILFLDSNRLESIPHGTFRYMHSLHWLKLQTNLLTKLEEETMGHILDTLQKLEISNNSLKCDCDIYWYFNWLSETFQVDENFDVPNCTAAYLVKRYNCKIRWQPGGYMVSVAAEPDVSFIFKYLVTTILAPLVLANVFY